MRISWEIEDSPLQYEEEFKSVDRQGSQGLWEPDGGLNFHAKNLHCWSGTELGRRVWETDLKFLVDWRWSPSLRPGALKSYPPPIPETRIRNSSFSTQGRNKKRSSDPGAHNPKYFSHVSTLPLALVPYLLLFLTKIYINSKVLGRTPKNTRQPLHPQPHPPPISPRKKPC